MARKNIDSNSTSAAAAAPATKRRTTRVREAVRTAAAAGQENPVELAAPAAGEPVTNGQGDNLSETDEIARLAYSYWEARGRQGGSPEEDWLRAQDEVRRRRADEDAR